MIFPLRLSMIRGFVTAIICVMILFADSTNATIPSLNLKVADTTAMPGALNTPISIFLDNIYDDVAGFNIWVQLDRPDVMVFQTDTITVYDSTFFKCNQYSGSNCIDSTEVFSWEPYDFFYDTVYIDIVGNFDSTGTLTSGWEFLDTRSLSGLGTDINIVGIADLPGGGVVPPIPAGQQGGVLLRILADVFSMDDEITDRTVNLLIQTDFKDHFSFSRADGSSITWIPMEIVDTTCYECTQWVGNICTNYEKVPRVLGQPIDTSLCDSMYIGLDTIAVLDSANVKVTNGSLTVLLSFLCGNINGSPDGQIDISDLVYLVDYMFGNPSGPEPVPYDAGNVNCTGTIDISDLVYFVDFMFGNPSGPEPCSSCP